jgi:deoxyxylulose-5-phosphate synthase
MTVVPQQKLSWQESARQVQAVRDRSIEQVDPAIAALPDTHTGRVVNFPRKHLSQTDIAITESSAETLVASLATGKLTAIAVTNAFLRRAAIAQKLVSNAAGCARQIPRILNSNYHSSA